MRIVSFGEVLWDIYPDKKCLGGAPLNFAAHLARHGLDAALWSAVGNDALGRETLTAVSDLGVDTRLILLHKDKPTGSCLVTLDERAVPSYNLLENVAYDEIGPLASCEGEVLYFGTLAQRSKINRRRLTEVLEGESFTEVFFDVNVRKPFFDKESLLLGLKYATIVKVSDEELPEVTAILGESYASKDEATERLAARCPRAKTVLLTCGKEGARAYDCRKKSVTVCPAYPAKVRSTVGAGDSFSAGYFYAYSEGRSQADCLSYASLLAALVVSRDEAIPPYRPSDLS